jgi:hypothetical protein
VATVFSGVSEGRGPAVEVGRDWAERIEFSVHCLERFEERFRPGLGLDVARRELSKVVENGVEVDAPPAWSGLALPSSRESFFLVGEDLVLVLLERGDGFIATTCVGRGTIRPSERRRRREGKLAGRRGGSGGSGKGRRKGRRPIPYCRSSGNRGDDFLGDDIQGWPVLTNV